jgi:hypothetical protein
MKYEMRDAERRWARRASTYSLLAIMLSLGGCFWSSEPSEDDILNSVQASVAMRRLVANDLPDVRMSDRHSWEIAGARALKTATIDKIGCVAAQSLPGLVCEYKIRITMPDGKKRSIGALGGPLRGRFVKGDHGWQMFL